MNSQKLTIETALFIAALVIGMAVRLYNLGAAPLSDAEAEWALQAVQVARPQVAGSDPVIGPQPAYVFLTGASFALFGVSNFLARFWPAILGAFLVLTPAFFRHPLGRTAALIMAFGLALDPGLTAASRQAGGPMMALAFSLLAIGLWQARKPIAAGLLGGLALLSGPAVIQGALGLGLAWAVVRYARRPAPQADEEQPESSSGPTIRTADLRLSLITILVTILLGGTFFFQYPQGLATWFGTLPAYLNGWVVPSGVSAAQLIAALVFYQPLALIFAAIGVISWLVQQKPRSGPSALVILFPLLWAVFSLVLALIYTGRQTTDLVWTLVPVWALAAIKLADYLPKEQPDQGVFYRAAALLEAGLVILLTVLFWNALIATHESAPLPNLPWGELRLAILVGILSLGALVTILIGLGWSWEASRDGLVWGLTAVLSVYCIGALWGATQLRANLPQELWSKPPATGQADLFAQTLNDLSNWNIGFPHTASVVSTVDTPSLRWILRDYNNLRFVTQPPVGELPEVIITRQEQEVPALTASYRGQDFAWWVRPGWQGALPPDLVAWLTFRQAPEANEQIILWARSDLFPGGSLSQENP